MTANQSHFNGGNSLKYRMDDLSHPRLLSFAHRVASSQSPEALAQFRGDLQVLAGKSSVASTLAWCALVQETLERTPEKVQELLAYPGLLLRYYSRDRLVRLESSSQFVAPDLRPLRPPPVLPSAWTQLLLRFRDGAIPPAEWTHRAHLQVGLGLSLWLPEEVWGEMRRGIQKLNKVNGIEQTPTGGYHETLTQLWLYLIKDAAKWLEAEPENGWNERELDAVLDPLSCTRLPLRFYSRERIMSWEARTSWVEPDLQPIPIP